MPKNKRKKSSKKAKKRAACLPRTPAGGVSQAVRGVLDKYHGGMMLRAVDESLAIIEGRDGHLRDRSRWIWEMMEIIGPKIKELLSKPPPTGNPVAIIQAVAKLAAVEQELASGRFSYAEKALAAVSAIESTKLQVDAMSGPEGEQGDTPEQYAERMHAVQPLIEAAVEQAMRKRWPKR